MISVIVPVYNVEAYLQRCVESLLNQDIECDYEIILVDDGSTDRSGEICESIQQANRDKVFVYHKQNGGLSSARNYGLKCARGEWISYVDSDDYVSERYLSVLYGMIQRFHADMSVVNTVKTPEGKEILEYTNRFDAFVTDKKEAFYKFYVAPVFGWYIHGKMYRKDILLRHLLPDIYYEDSASLYLLVEECENIAFGDYKDAYHYITRSGSITTSQLSEKHMVIFDTCDSICAYIDKKYPEWAYAKVLIYQNAVLQLLVRLTMTHNEFRMIFLRYRKMFRENCLMIVMHRHVKIKEKYYTILLSSWPVLFKIHKALMKTLSVFKRQ